MSISYSWQFANKKKNERNDIINQLVDLRFLWIVKGSSQIMCQTVVSEPVKF